MSGSGTPEAPWTLTTPAGGSTFLTTPAGGSMTTPAGGSTFQMHVNEEKQVLHYQVRATDDLYAMLKAHGDWMELGNKDEKQDAKEGTVEAWGRSPDNPVGGWYGLRKGYRGRFANYVTAVLKLQGEVEYEKRGRSWWVQAI
jgi:hypothetical protein